MQKRNRTTATVELNLTAMLDMAFQLLAFFILTFRTAPNEGQVVFNLPPAAPLKNTTTLDLGGEHSLDSPPQGADTLVVRLHGGQSGRIEQLAIGDRNLPSLDRLKTELLADIANPKTNFGQVILQIDSNVRYENVMQVIDLCRRAKYCDGRPLSSLSLVERR